MRSVYVYYKLRPENAARLRAQVNAVQSELARRFGISGFLQRGERRGDAQETWMEVYPRLSPQHETIVDSAIHEAGLAQLIEGERRKEVFEDMSGCV